MENDYSFFAYLSELAQIRGIDISNDKSGFYFEEEMFKNIGAGRVLKKDFALFIASYLHLNLQELEELFRRAGYVDNVSQVVQNSLVEYYEQKLIDASWKVVSAYEYETDRSHDYAGGYAVRGYSLGGFPGASEPDYVLMLNRVFVGSIDLNPTTKPNPTFYINHGDGSGEFLDWRQTSMFLFVCHQFDIYFVISQEKFIGPLDKFPSPQELEDWITRPRKVYFQINEEPILAITVSKTLSSLSELYTKFWLTAQGRLEDLIKFTTTHDPEIARETALLLGKVSHNSPFNGEIKVDLSPKGVAEALVTTIDGIWQAKDRKRKLELENRELTDEIERKNKLLESELKDKDQARRIEEENHILELQQRQIALKRQITKDRLELMNDALDIAKKAVDLLYPDADTATRGAYAQTYVKNILELGEISDLQAFLQLPSGPGNTSGS